MGTKHPAPDLEDVRVGNARNADTLDDATEIQERINAEGLDRSRKALQPQQHALFNGKDCLDCGDDMVPERLASGRIRCVGCQTKIERNFR